MHLSNLTKQIAWGCFGFTLVAILTVLPAFGARGKADSDEPAASAVQNHAFSGKINKVWVDYDIYEKDKKGMRIHVSFDADSLKDRRCRATAYFHWASGWKLKDYNDDYDTVAGHVAAGKDFTPSYENSTYRDFKLFMPYSELHIEHEGKHELKFLVELYDRQTLATFAKSGWYYFRYTVK